MGIAGTLKDVVRICTTLVSFIRDCYHWFRNHFIILGLICILLLVFRVFPSVLRFFISSSPIFICTAVFLRALLSFGPSDEEKKICETSEDFSKIQYVSLVNMDSNEPVSNKTSDDLDDVECSSTESAPINMLPVIDETDPLLDSRVPRLPLTSIDDSDPALESSDKSVDESGDSEVENQAKGNEENGAKSLVNWTEDDQKNLMDLGSSELERNQRLESLIARRRARKSFLQLSEKSLIDFDTNDSSFHVPSISTMKNPFDVPYNSSEIDGLRVPGSAPSCLVPRKNPFDLPYDPQEEKPNLTQDSFHQEYMSIFCRHESFSLGYAGNRQDRYNHRFTPLFGDEDTEEEEEEERFEFSNSNAQSGERRNSLFGAVPESDALPPIDPKNRKKKMGRVMSLGVYPFNDRRERKFADVPWIRTDQGARRDVNLNQVDTEEARNDSSLHGRTGAFTESEVVSESSPSSSSDINEEVVDVKKDELESENIEPSVADDEVKKRYTETKEATLEDTDINNQVMEEVKDARIKETAYNSSDSSSSMASDMHVEVSEAGSPGGSFDRNLCAESLCRGGIDKKAIESRDNVVEENEVKLIDDAAVSEHVSASEDLVAAAVEPKLSPEQPVGSSNSALPLPSDVESEVQVEPDAAPSPSSDLDKGETPHEDSQDNGNPVSDDSIKGDNMEQDEDFKQPHQVVREHMERIGHRMLQKGNVIGSDNTEVANQDQS